MIVREQEGRFLLIKQHDHGLVSKVFASHWGERINPHKSTLYAIKHHDVGWKQLDKEIRWNEEANRPYSFIDYPLESKLPAYRKGIEQVQEKDLYAACLCSMHYASFFSEETEPAAVHFYQEELNRQKRLRQHMTIEEQETLAYNLQLLQFFDYLSLFLCLNEPGENQFPWFRKGIPFRDSYLIPTWEETNVLRFDSNLFRTPFEVSFPYQLVDLNRQVEGRGQYTFQIV